MNVSERIEAFVRLGEYLDRGLCRPETGVSTQELSAEQLFPAAEICKAAAETTEMNPWFIPYHIYFALKEISGWLKMDTLDAWLADYPSLAAPQKKPLQVGTVMAGNIPLAGFHDFLCVLLSGSRFKGKLSGKDDKLLPFLAERLVSIHPAFRDLLQFEESRLGQVDAIIATGSNNTSRYFDYYFGRYPHIFRKNRNGVALLTSQESQEELEGLADDVFLYFGLGCRNVSKLFVPENYPFEDLFPAFEKYSHLIDHHKYGNNYQYQRSVYLLNQVEHLDNGFLILKRDSGFSSPVGTLYYEQYDDSGDLQGKLQANMEKIQCVVSSQLADIQTISFGQSQKPKVRDYSDNMDTLKFLSNLYKN